MAKAPQTAVAPSPKERAAETTKPGRSRYRVLKPCIVNHARTYPGTAERPVYVVAANGLAGSALEFVEYTDLPETRAAE